MSFRNIVVHGLAFTLGALASALLLHEHYMSDVRVLQAQVRNLQLLESANSYGDKMMLSRDFKQWTSFGPLSEREKRFIALIDCSIALDNAALDRVLESWTHVPDDFVTTDKYKHLVAKRRLVGEYASEYSDSACKYIESLRSNQPLQPTPSAGEAPAEGAGERRR